MNKFDIQSTKNIGIILAICVIFMIVVWHAYSYLPQSENTKYNLIKAEEPSDIQDANSNEVIEAQSEDIDETEDEDIEGNHLEDKNSDRDAKTKTAESASEKKEQQLEPLENISDEESNNEKFVKEEDSSPESMFEKANQYKLNNKPTQAISEYQKVLAATNSTYLKAQCYENIAIIYAASRRFGSALSAAQKAYNTEPTISRELLLARLYYKIGDSEKSNYRIKSILRKDFIIE